MTDINDFFHGQLGEYLNTDTTFYPSAYKDRGFGFDGIDDVITLPKNLYQHIRVMLPTTWTMFIYMKPQILA